MLKQTLLEMLLQSTFLEIYFFQKHRLAITLMGSAWDNNCSIVEAKVTGSFVSLEPPLCGLPNLDKLFLSCSFSMGLASIMIRHCPPPRPWIFWDGVGHSCPGDLAVGSHAHGSSQRTADCRMRHCPPFPYFLWPSCSVSNKGDGQRGRLLLKRGPAIAFHSISERGQTPPNQETNAATLHPILHSDVDPFSAQSPGILWGFSDHKTVTPTKKVKSVCL